MIELYTSKNKDCINNDSKCKVFLQKMMNRLTVGHYRYGKGTSDQRYAKRAENAIKRYLKTHNTEYLFDIANYALLETIFPMFKDTHHKDLDSQGRNTIPS